MDNIFVYLVKLPRKTKEVVMPCLDGYTIYINQALDFFGQRKAYKHALRHIKNRDFEKHDVQEIEAHAHEMTKR